MQDLSPQSAAALRGSGRPRTARENGRLGDCHSLGPVLEVEITWQRTRCSAARGSKRTTCQGELGVARYPCYHVSVIQLFGNEGTEDVFNGRSTKKARAVCPTDLWRVAWRKLDQLDSVERLDELAIPPGNRLEALSGDRLGRHSIRINERYRICFACTGTGPVDVEITHYHK